MIFMAKETRHDGALIDVRTARSRDFRTITALTAGNLAPPSVPVYSVGRVFL